MSFAYAQKLKHARLQAVIDHVGPGASLEFGERAGIDVVLATVRLSSPPFLPPVDGEIQFAGLPLIGAVFTAGLATTARIVDAAGTVQIYDFSVGPAGSGAQIEISNNNLQPATELRIIAASIVHA